jgi:AmmeMemoRadiSam system protein B
MILRGSPHGIGVLRNRNGDVRLHPDERLEHAYLMPAKPRLRTVNALPATHKERRMVLLQDPLGIANKSVLIPPEITPLLFLCDGTRTVDQILGELRAQFGFELNREELDAWMELFDDATLLDNDNYRDRRAQVLKSFREKDHRPMILSDDIYPADAGELKQILEPYLAHARHSGKKDGIKGMICPHIDYSRGWRVYAQVMASGRETIKSADLIIILGTDHFDDGNPLSLTLQNYRTPNGTLKTPGNIVTAIRDVVPDMDLFEGELRHRFEHSIELALTWLHYMRDGDPCEVVPILCGAHDLFFEQGSRQEFTWVSNIINELRQITQNRNALIVAAADLAHVGIAFGGEAVSIEERVEVARADERLLQQVKEGSPEQFIDEIFHVNDRYNVCGITPIYLLLRLLEPCEGEVVGYELCPADQDGTSWVSICGTLLG